MHFLILPFYWTLLFVVGCTKPIQITTFTVAMTNVKATVSMTTSGTIHAHRDAILNFNTSGRVATIYVSLGDTVIENQMLANLDNQDLQLNLKNTINDHHRNTRLFTQKVISPQDFEDSKLALMKAKVDLERSIIKAPFKGIVVEQNLKVGLVVNQFGSSEEAMRLVDAEKRFVKGPIDELDMARVRVGQHALVTIPAFRTHQIKAIVTKIIPIVTASREMDRTTTIELEISELFKTPIPVGASADVEIVVDSRKSVLAIPSKLLLGRGKKQHVFLLREGKLVKQLIQSGIGNYERIEIVKGLKIGDDIVVPSEKIRLEAGLRAKIRKSL